MVHQQKPAARSAAGFCFFGAFQRGLDGGEKLREQFCLLTDVNIPPLLCKQTKQPCVAVCRGGVQNAEPPIVHHKKSIGLMQFVSDLFSLQIGTFILSANKL